MAVAYVSSAGTDSFSANSLAVSTGSLTVGNLVAGAVMVKDDTTTISSVTDTQGNTYTVRTAFNSGGAAHSVQFFWGVVTTGGTGTLTANLSATVACILELHQLSGTDTTAPIDGEGATFNFIASSGTDVVTGPSITTTANGDYIFVAAGTFSGSAFTAGTGYTLRENTVANWGRATEELTGNQTSAGSITPTLSTSSSSFRAIVGVQGIKAAAASDTLMGQILL